MHEFIAEIGTSHLGSFEKAKCMIDAARKVGATTAKFQWVIADEIISKHAGIITLPNGDTNIYEYFLSVEKDKDFYAKLKSYTEKCGLEFLCSVFGLKSLHLLLQLNPKRIKIASPEINHRELLQSLAQHKVAVVLSSGVSTLIDLLRAVNILRAGKIEDIAILRCVTEYPASPYSYALQLLEKYQTLFQCQCGISDHTQETSILPTIAAAYGSTMVEKHFFLPNEHDEVTRCPDDPIALSPHAFSEMVKSTTNIATIYKTKGHRAAKTAVKKCYGEKTVHAVIGTRQSSKKQKHSAALLPHYFTTRRSLFARTNIAKGNILTPQNCILHRSEHNTRPGIPTEAYTTILGKKVHSKIAKGMPITFEHFL